MESKLQVALTDATKRRNVAVFLSQVKHMKTRPIVFSAMFFGALTMFASDVLACGESLFRVGQGVRYRAYAVPIPANVLVYANTKEQLEMAQMLAQAGHGVQIVNDAAELDRHLGDSGSCSNARR